jgi:DNA-binding response OmpR family regulator
LSKLIDLLSSMECPNFGEPTSTATQGKSARPMRARSGNLELWVEHQQVWAEDRRVKLSAIQFEILAFLVRREQHISSREAIYEAVWGTPMPAGTRMADVHICKMRQKLDRAAPGWTYIHTHFQRGYRFEAEPS